MKLTTFTIFGLLLIISCSSPKKKFENGDYTAAFNTALKNLQKEKKAADANRDILLRALDKIYLDDRKEISFYENSDGLINLEKAFKTNQNLLDKIEKATPYLDDKFAFNYQQSIEHQKEMSRTLIDGFMQLGQEHLTSSMENSNKFLAQDAFTYFKKAEKYGAMKSSLESLYQLCYEHGTLIYRVSANAVFDLSYNWEIDRIFESIQGNRNFITVLYEQDADYVDCEIEVSFKSLDIDEFRSRDSQNFEESVVTGYETVSDTSGYSFQREIRKNVEGKVTTTKITKKAQWRAYVYIKGYSNNCQLSENNWSMSTESIAETIQTSGDVRAIPSTFQASSIVNLSNDSDMAGDLIEDVYEKFRRVYF